MNPETKAFLDQVRDAEDPSAETEQRVLQAVHSTMAMGAAPRATAHAATGTKLSTVSTATVMKAGAIGLVLVGASMIVPPGSKVDPARSRGANAAVVPRKAAPSDEGVSRSDVDPQRVHEREGESVRVPERESPMPPKKQTPSEAHARSSSGMDGKAKRISSLRAELTLLAEVRAALQRGDGAAALRTLDGHVTSDRQLLGERQVARVLALCAVGKTREAQQAASEFLRRHPSSPHSAVLAESCAASTESD